MWVWKVLADSEEKMMKDAEDISENFCMNDSDILLDCISESIHDIYFYILSESVKACEEKKLIFRGFEIIAN